MVGRTARFGLLAVLPLVVGAAASAQSRDLADTPEMVPTYINPAEPADMVFDVMEHNFGTVSDDKEVEFTFKFVNKGVGTLRITSTKGSCSCTVPAPSKKEFKPGESGEIRVIYNPKGKSGEQHQQVTVNTNDAETPVILLQIQANVFPEVQVKPRVGHFGEIAKDQVATLDLTITGRKPEFEITGYELSEPDMFTVEIGKMEDTTLTEEEAATARRSASAM
ncbi:MAG: DUF1573 domain-containing protein [Phycisphaerales bacterium]|nr:DUF1573 domain-containing protein [Phycisphaerales bacterium]